MEAGDEQGRTKEAGDKHRLLPQLLGMFRVRSSVRPAHEDGISRTSAGLYRKKDNGKGHTHIRTFMDLQPTRRYKHTESHTQQPPHQQKHHARPSVARHVIFSP